MLRKRPDAEKIVFTNVRKHSHLSVTDRWEFLPYVCKHDITDVYNVGSEMVGFAIQDRIRTYGSHVDRSRSAS